MDDLAKLARKMGGWEKLAREFYQTLIPYLETERNKRREEERLCLEIWGGQVKSRGRPSKRDMFLGKRILDALEQSKRTTPYTNHWQQVARQMYPGLRGKKEDARIKSLRNIVSEHKRRIKHLAVAFPEGNVLSPLNAQDET